MRSLVWTALVLAVPALAAAAGKENGKSKSLDPAGIERLKSSAAGPVRVSTSEATGSVRFAGIEPGESGDLMPSSAAPRREKARAFLHDYAGVFGLSNVDADLQLEREQSDELGATHLSYSQSYRGVPVFAGVLRAHFGSSGELTAVNGNVVPGIQVDPNPTRSAVEAGATAIAAVAADNPGRDVFVRSGVLMVYRTGLVRGTEGDNYLTWQMEVGNGADVREFVYVDAQSGKVVDRLPGIVDAMYRRAYDGQNLNGVPPSYPNSPYWYEGQPFPTASTEANNMIIASKETYDLYFNGFGRDSFDGAGKKMDSIFNRGYSCPNASWNGTFISFCPGFTTDDVTAHEWSHAYTQYTDGLIYAWQPGALNESYSDIFGETVDRINGRGLDSPDAPRAGACSVFGGTPPPTLTITNAGGTVSYQSRASVNEPPRPFTVGPANMIVPVPASACSAITNDISGKIALVDWTLTPSGGNECGSGARATNVYNAHAAGIIFVAPASGILNLGSITQIASVEVTRADGNTIIAGLPGQATISLGVGTENSYRWLMGEEVTPGGALRDMSNPRCFGNPGKVSDTFEYACSTADQGGVHTNSGVPNHAYQLLVDGGTFNGQTITGIGLTKAAHIYFRAKLVYQHPTTDFPDHADAIEQSAADLVGVNLPDLNTGAPSGLSINAADVDQVKKAMLAVEMRTPPVACGFQPLLAQNPPALCPAPKRVQNIFQDTFEEGDYDWTVSHDAVTPADFTPRDWQVVDGLPDDRTGHAFFAVDPTYGTCAPGGDQSGVLNLTSPEINLSATATNPRLTFVHWVATELGYDGGNLWISVNGGAYTRIAPADFIYNPYNRTLVTAAAGNTDPLAGQPAWSGTDGGAVDGTWGRSIVNLAPYAQAGDKIRLRYEFGTDGCGGAFGWYVDDVTVYRCK
jgi:Zn-dependent metalloprotease